MLGSFSYFKDGWGGSHNFKIGGEIFDERFDYQRGQGGVGYVPGDVLHILRNGSPTEVLLFLSPTASLNGLRTYGAYLADTWRVGPRLTLTLGARFDRYRSYLPGADRSAGRPVQSDAGDVPRRRQPADVESACATRRHDLRPQGRRQDHAEGELPRSTGGTREPGRLTSR